MAAIPDTVELPFPISKLAHHYLIYDVNVVSYVRKEHNICGVLMGTLPQSPQQNVFQGLPLQLMPEEARVLVERGVAYLEDDATAHKRTFLASGLSVEERKAYQAALRRQGLGAAKETSRKKAAEKLAAIRRNSDFKPDNWNDVPEDMLRNRLRREKNDNTQIGGETNQQDSNAITDDALFSSSPISPTSGRNSISLDTADPDPLFVTPTTSDPPLHSSPPLPNASTSLRFLPKTPPSYPLFAHLHADGYYLTPGLRFGCQYMAYPGDPLRFHSHFLCNGMEWDQEFDLIDLVGGGRLGTGVKKGFLIGGEEESPNDKDNKSKIRTFCVEWAGI